MTLFWPSKANQVVLDQPRLHVFIIGVGEYVHLGGGTGKSTPKNFGLSQLESTRTTAERLANWFVSNAKPPHPLGSVELLLSPKGDVVRDTDGKVIKADPPLIAQVEKAFNRWKTRCDSLKDNIALFYFAGHGLSTARQYLLPGDFANPDFADHWRNCIDFTGLKVGMGSCKAATQVFFVDACREKLVDVALEQNISGMPLCSADLNQVTESSSVYYAASDGFQAFGPPDAKEMTYFGQAVLKSFQGAGAANSDGAWSIDTASMGLAIARILDQMSDNLENVTLTCNPSPSGLSRVLHIPSDPHVLTAIECEKDMAIIMQRKNIVVQSMMGEDRPWLQELAPGEWHIKVADDSQSYFDADVLLSPPVFTREVRR